MATETASEIIGKYRSSFRAANNRGVHVVFENGWYRVSDGMFGGRYRAKQIKQMTETLEKRANKEETP